VDPREDIALALDDPEVRRASIAPPPLRGLVEVPRPHGGDTGGRPDDDGGDPAAGGLPGRRRNRLQYLELYLTGGAYEILTAARAKGTTMGQAVMEALRHSRPWLIDQYAPAAPEDDFFPAARRTHRRLKVEAGRHVSAGVTPEEAAAVSRLAAEVDLSLSEMVNLAIEHHFADRIRGGA
jgi:hypothetical protein